jgi:hypothetical protein
VPAGSVGLDLTALTSRKIRRAMDAGGGVVAEVEFRGQTPSGGLRHPAIKGFKAG